MSFPRGQFSTHDDDNDKKDITRRGSQFEGHDGRRVESSESSRVVVVVVEVREVWRESVGEMEVTVDGGRCAHSDWQCPGPWWSSINRPKWQRAFDVRSPAAPYPAGKYA